MATDATFSSMLREFTPYNLMVEEMKKRDYFFNKAKKRLGWKPGAVMIVPFEGGEASSLSFGALTASNNIAETVAVEGSISTLPELWGTMLFNEKDLDNDGLEKSFMQIIPGKLNQFMSRMQQRVSICMLGDGSIAKLTSNGLASGVTSVDRPELFTVGEYVEVDDDDSAKANGYVTAVDVSAGTITIKDARSAGSAVDLSGYTTAQNAKVYLPNGVASGFTGLKSQLLSSANGGSSTLFGQTKASYPFLQAYNHDGSSITANNILDVLYDGFFDVATVGKGAVTEILMSYKNFKNCAIALQNSRRFQAGEKNGGYGFRSIDLLGPENDMRITGIREMPDDACYHIDWNAVEIVGDKFFERKRHMNNEEFYLTRATTGYTYIVDWKFYGDCVLKAPSHCGITHSISYTD